MTYAYTQRKWRIEEIEVRIYARYKPFYEDIANNIITT